ncbi:MAG: hypothetical protein RIQ56_95 [Candidatus Parcubacteria bacterium]
MKSEENDLNILIGRKVAVLNIHRWGGQLILDSEGSAIKIGFDSGVLFTGSDGKTIELDDMRTSGGLMCSILDIAIVGVEGRSPDPKYADYQLVLKFEGDTRLEIMCCAFVNVEEQQIFPKA